MNLIIQKPFIIKIIIPIISSIITGITMVSSIVTIKPLIEKFSYPFRKDRKLINYAILKSRLKKFDPELRTIESYFRMEEYRCIEVFIVPLMMSYLFRQCLSSKGLEANKKSYICILFCLCSLLVATLVRIIKDKKIILSVDDIDTENVFESIYNAFSSLVLYCKYR